MRTKQLNILLVFLAFLFGCQDTKKEIIQNYIESQPTFFELKNGDWLTNKWIRNPENLKTVHETFKKIGYSTLISASELSANPLIIQDIYINNNGYQLLDSLELTYNQPQTKEKYYREFWIRRKKEKNEQIVYQIIKDINYAFKHKLTSAELSFKSNKTLVNDTLLSLLQIEFRTDSLTNELAQKDFNELRNLGFHNSAYNLLYENTKYENITWNKDSLKSTLTKSKTNNNSWFQDNAK